MHLLLDRIRFFLIISAGVLFVAAIFTSHAEARSFGKDRFKKHRQLPSWYVGVSGSVNFVDDADITDSDTGSTSAAGEINFDEGYGLNAALGYRPRNTRTGWDNIRIEAALGYQSSDLSSFTSSVSGTTTTSLNNETDVRTAMANIYVDFDASPNWRPYVGTGIGGARGTTNINSSEQSDTVFAYQGMVGLSYIPSSFPVAELFAGYRYLATQDFEFINPNNNTMIEQEYESHNLEAGARFYF